MFLFLYLEKSWDIIKGFAIEALSGMDPDKKK